MSDGRPKVFVARLIPAEGIERWVALPGSSTNTGSHDHVSLFVEGAAPAGSEPFT